jgi:hypothetical protein
MVKNTTIRQTIHQRHMIYLMVLTLGSASGTAFTGRSEERDGLRSMASRQEGQVNLGTVLQGFSPPFEENRGQLENPIRFASHFAGYDLFLTPREILIALPKGKAPDFPGLTGFPSLPERRTAGEEPLIRLFLRGGNPSVAITGIGELRSKTHYFIGRDPERWVSRVPHFSSVKYSQVYPGIDLLFRTHQGEIEWDFLVASGSDPQQISLQAIGVDKLEIDTDGNLRIQQGKEHLTINRPSIFQELSGNQTAIEGGYLIEEEIIRFQIGPSDRRLPLVIDPVLSYSSYLAGSGGESARAAAVDTSGNIYVAGPTESLRFFASYPRGETVGRPPDIFLAKLDPSGAEVIFLVYLGGQGAEGLFDCSIALDDQDNVYITGDTRSDDFPLVNPLFDTLNGSGDTSFFDSFIAKLSADGTQLIYSTYLGGSRSDVVFDVAVASDRAACVVGGTNSTDFPAVNAFQGQSKGGGFLGSDAVVSCLDESGERLVYSTYLGGSGDDAGFSIDIDSGGQAYVAGATSSSDFPSLNGYQMAFGGGENFLLDAFISSFESDGTLSYSSYFGGEGDDAALAVAVDNSGQAHVGGVTSSANFPRQSAFQPDFWGGGAYGIDAFVAKISSTGTGLLYSSLLGGSRDDIVLNLTLVGDGGVCLTGATSSEDFPVREAFQPGFGSNQVSRADAFVTHITQEGHLGYSSFLGGGDDDYGYGIAFASDLGVIVVGETKSNNFPVVHALESAFKGGGRDSFVARISPTKQLFFAHFADGSGEGGPSISSLIVLYNLNFASSANVLLELRTDDGSPLNVDLNGEQVPGGLEVAIPAGGSVTLETDGQGLLQTGSVSIVADQEISGVILFRGYGTEGILSNDRLRRFHAPVRTDPELKSGIALMGIGPAQMVTLQLRNPDGSIAGRSSVSLGYRHHVAKLLDELNWQPKIDLSNFRGVLTGSGESDFAATLLLVGRDQYATLPVKASEEPDFFHFAQFGNGKEGKNSINSELIFFNLSPDNPVEGEFIILDKQGSHIAIPGKDETPCCSLQIPPEGSFGWESAGTGPLTVGSAHVFSQREKTGGQLSGVLLFHGYGLSGVLPSQELKKFVAPIIVDSDVTSGVALVGLAPQELELELRNQAGAVVSKSRLMLPNWGSHVAKLVNEFEWNPSIEISDFSGTLLVSGLKPFSGTVILVVPGEFATFPVTRLY